MYKIIRVGLIYFIYMMIAACSGMQTENLNDENYVNDEPEVNYPSNQINQFIFKLYTVINDNNQSGFTSMWDLNEYGSKISSYATGISAGSNAMPVNQEQTRFFAIGTIKETFMALSESEMFLLETDTDSPSVKFRVVKGGENYYITMLLKRLDDGYVIVDLIDHTIGITQSEKTGFLQSLYYKNLPEEKVMAKRILQSTQYMQRGEPFKAKELLDSLPEAYLSNKTVLGIYLRVASMLDEQALLDGYKLVERFYGNDASASYLIATLYLLEEKPLQAIDELNVFIDIIGPDAELELLIGELYLANGYSDRALLHANAALRIDPSFHTSYWLLSRIFIERQDWETAVLALDVLKERFDYEFKKEFFEEDESFTLIMQDRNFQLWLSTLET